MPQTIDKKKFYRTQEAIELIGVSRSTLFRWLREKRIEDVKYKDHRGWRLWSQQEIKKVKEFNESLITNR